MPPPPQQKYKKEWESEEWARGWLTSPKPGEFTGKAFCSYCTQYLRPQKKILHDHSLLMRHITKSKSVKSSKSVEKFFTVIDTRVMSAELNTVAMIARSNIPIRFSEELIQTNKHCLSDSETAKKMTSSRTKTTYLLTECLYPAAHKDLVKRMSESDGFSILCDKATDVSMKKVFCIRVCFYDHNSQEVVSRLYRLIELSEGTATGLFQAISQALEEDNLDWTNVVGYASDGENLMQGVGPNSLLALIKEKIASIYILKCFCHSFHLVADYACRLLSQSAEVLVHDCYNYMKNSPNRLASYGEFQVFCALDPVKILKPCQTRWLSLRECVGRMIQQLPALELFFEAEVSDLKTKNSQAERIKHALHEPAIVATIEFMDSVLGDLTGLNKIFQSETFELHRLIPELTKVIKLYASNFMPVHPDSNALSINIDQQDQWLPLDKVYPGVNAQNTLSSMKPHQKETFLKRCRDWYREAIRQICMHVNLLDPVLLAMASLDHQTKLENPTKVDRGAIGILVSNLPLIVEKQKTSLQSLNRLVE